MIFFVRKKGEHSKKSYVNWDKLKFVEFERLKVTSEIVVLFQRVLTSKLDKQNPNIRNYSKVLSKSQAVVSHCSTYEWYQITLMFTKHLGDSHLMEKGNDSELK